VDIHQKVSTPDIHWVSAAGMPVDQQQDAADGGGNVMSTVFRTLVIYFVFSSFMKKAPQEAKDDKGTVRGVDDTAGQQQALPPFSNMFRLGQEMDLRIFLSESEGSFVQDDLVWSEDSIFFDWQESNSRSQNITLPLDGRWSGLQRNGSAFAHVYFTLPGVEISPPNGAQQRYRRNIIYAVHQLNRYAARPKVKTTTNLLGYGKKDTDVHDVEREASVTDSVAPATGRSDVAAETFSLWKPKMTINLVVDHTIYARQKIPPQIAKAMHFDKATGKYEPKLFRNDFWLLRESLFPLNTSVRSVDLEMEYYPISMWKWQLIEQMESSWSQQREMGTGGGETETEILKNMLTETSPALLVTTAVVSVLHMVFDCLAFKNDIKFWRNQKSLEGLSVGTVFINCFCSVVIFLYLCNSEEISRMILLSQGMGLCIEFWKIKKVVHVQLDFQNKILGIIPRLGYKHRRSYQTVTAKYDAIAMRYMSYVLYPAVVGYSVYSLRYESHRGWYSWVLGSMVGSVYTFGFIRMTPQLYINYKLKSVAHMPWRVMVYKSLNTFIDDLFAFIITMPLLHRLACFRDDLIFFIFLYQRQVYTVDETRLNEFGVSAEMYAETGAQGQPAQERKQL
jgi:hypothetical protein